jgi:uncharacterized protein with PIN domain
MPAAAAVRAGLVHFQLGGRDMSCAQCGHQLDCIDHQERLGTWLGSFKCPRCRSEYFYSYRWRRLVRRFDL